MSVIERLASADELEDRLSDPSDADVACMRRLAGDVIVLGAGGKMGPSLTRRVIRASAAAGVKRHVIAVSRFSSQEARRELERWGAETVLCDLLDPDDISRLPRCDNVLYLAGRKFGSTERTDLTWAANTVAPAHVARHFHHAAIVAFSTGNVYPFVDAGSGGSVETDAVEPRGEYAQSCLGRERVFEYFSREFGTRTLIFRLNYATDLRYGVLVDIARTVAAGRPIDLTVGYVNTLWQGDANSYALRALELVTSPPRVLNVTGPEKISVREAALFFGRRLGRPPVFHGDESPMALLSDASQSYALLGKPEVTAAELMDAVVRWIERGGVSLGRPTKYEVVDGKF